MKSFKQFCTETRIVPTEFQCTLTELIDEIADLREYFDRVAVSVDEEFPLTVALTFEKREESGE